MLFARLLCLTLVVLISACSTSYTANNFSHAKQWVRLDNKHQLTRSNQWRLARDTSLYLAKPVLPMQVTSGVLAYNRARYSLLQSMESALSIYYPSLQASSVDMSMEEALIASRLSGSRILVFPRLLEYPDSGPSHQSREKIIDVSHAHFQVLLVDVYTGEILDTGTISSRSSIHSANSTAANELMASASKHYAAQLAGLNPQ